MKEYQLILGSQSPRRKQLLSAAGFTFKIDVRPIEESFDANMDVKKVAEYLSLQKAMEFKSTIKSNEMVLTADSIVVLNGLIYEKPKDKADAIRILQELSGRTHTVYTGVTLLTQDKTTSFTDSTRVTFGELTLDEIEMYIDNHQPFDKAGSYGIQDWIGLCKVQKIEGSYANVMGLPVHRVYQEIQQF